MVEFELMSSHKLPYYYNISCKYIDLVYVANTFHHVLRSTGASFSCNVDNTAERCTVQFTAGGWFHLWTTNKHEKAQQLHYFPRNEPIFEQLFSGQIHQHLSFLRNRHGMRVYACNLSKLTNHRSYLHSLLSFPSRRYTRSSSLITLSRPSLISRLKIANRSYYHSFCFSFVEKSPIWSTSGCSSHHSVTYI